jgi:uncharacterized protein YydD (DUF2326 family)
MFLKKLTVISNGKAIREVNFKEGVNLIIDEASSDKITDSGNSVGKTTLLRVVDFCFGSSGSDIYTDNEFKTPNEEVLEFLNSNSIAIILELLRGKEKFVLERRFSSENQFFINSEEYNSLKDYKAQLEKVFFSIRDSKPSIRQIMPKFIRKDVNIMSNTLNYLHSTTKKDDYEVVFLYLFGFADHSLLIDRLRVSYLQKKVERSLKALKQTKPITTARQILKLTEDNILSLEKELNKYKISKAYNAELIRLNEIKKRISNYTNSLSNLRMKLELNTDTLNELESTRSKIDPLTVQELYSEAQRLIPSLQKQFEEVLEFHNQMIGKKIEFINSKLIETNMLIKNDQENLNYLLKEEEKILKTLSEVGSLKDLELIQRELNQLYERKGKESQFIALVENEESNLKRISQELQELNIRVEMFLKDFDLKIGQFNYYFSRFSKQLYNEEYILSYNIQNNGKIVFLINNTQGNVGSGKKKGQVAAFDLAYISFLNEIKSRLPKFVMHDGIEDIHINQIGTLFEIANSLNGQYIVSVLRDKLDFLTPEQIENDKILSLAQDDLFFKFYN